MLKHCQKYRGRSNLCRRSTTSSFKYSEFLKDCEILRSSLAKSIF